MKIGLLWVSMDDNVCIQLYPELFNPYQIVCVRHRSGKVVWRGKVWSSMTGGGMSGRPAKHLAIPVVHRNLVYIFGADGGGAIYLEVFRIKDGKPVLRFSTAY